MNITPTLPFLGINTRLPDFSLSTDKGQWLREAVNVDITNSGSLVRRKAAVKRQALTAPHSLVNSFLVRSSTLYKITFDPYTETLVKVLTSNAPMSYVVINGDTYYSNGTDSGRITAAGAVYPWALPTPAAPVVTPTTGSLFKGKYQVAVSYKNATTGEEGGVSASSNYELVSDGGLVIALPSATTGATHVNVYVSTVNGAIPMLQTGVVAGTASVTITSHTLGREANQRYEEPLPAGTRLFEFNGRLCSVKDKDICYGIPFRPGYYLPVEGRISFPQNVSIAAPNQGGVYVAADKTYFFAGQDLGAVEVVRDVLPYGAVPGTEFKLPNKSLVGWFGAKGIVLADPQGEVQAVMSDTVDVTPPASGVSIVFETRGYRRVVSCGWCLNLDNLAVTTYSGWGFNSATGGYAAASDGLYLLEEAGAVDAHISLGKENFGSEMKKMLPGAYLGVYSETTMMVRVTTPDGTYYDYYARNSSANGALMIHRVDFGKGLRENWYEIKVFNTEGSDFTLASISTMTLASSRRI